TPTKATPNAKLMLRHMTVLPSICCRPDIGLDSWSIKSAAQSTRLRGCTGVADGRSAGHRLGTHVANFLQSPAWASALRLGERVHREIAVGPGPDRCPARALRQQAERLNRVLVAVLGMNGLAGRELDHMTGNVNRLPSPAHKMHLDAAALAVVERPMAERVDIEIG